MANTILLTDSAPLLAQARTHHLMSNYTSIFVRCTQKPHDDAFLAAAGASEMPEMGDTYATWVSSFQDQVASHAVAHLDVADKLTGVVNDFHTVDTPVPVPS